jgi:hypothetical protein
LPAKIFRKTTVSTHSDGASTFSGRDNLLYVRFQERRTALQLLRPPGASHHHAPNERCKKPVSLTSTEHLFSGRGLQWRTNQGTNPRVTTLILFEIISLAVLARFSWQRLGNKLLFWGLVAVIAVIAAIYFLMFRDVPLRPL